MAYTLTHTSRANRKTIVEFSTLEQARVEAYRWRRSPKTRKVVLGYTPDTGEGFSICERIPNSSEADGSSLLNPSYASSNPSLSWFETTRVWIDDKLSRLFRY